MTAKQVTAKQEVSERSGEALCGPLRGILSIKKIIALLGLALLHPPTLSHAKIGETRTEVEARAGKPVELAAFWREKWPEQMKAAPKGWEMYRSDFYPTDVQAEDPVFKYKGVWFGVDKVIGEWYPNAVENETVVRALKKSLGTSDLVENPDKKFVLHDCASYITRDHKYVAYVLPFVGTFVGTPAFVDVILEPAVTKILEAMAKE